MRSVVWKWKKHWHCWNIIHSTRATPLFKLLKSAINNWEQKNEGKSAADAGLVVKTIFVDGARTLKRMLPAPQGRAYRMRKRSNHVTLIVDIKAISSESGKCESEKQVENAKKLIDKNFQIIINGSENKSYWCQVRDHPWLGI